MTTGTSTRGISGPLPQGQLIRGGSAVGGTRSLGTSFTNIVSGKPNAPIQKAKVDLPNRGSFGSPTGTPTVADPNRASYGTPSAFGVSQAAGAAQEAQRGFRDPTPTKAFQNIMGLAQEQTGLQAQEQSRHARDAGQRRGYAGGFEDTARQANQDRMQALASSGFAGAESVRQQEGEQYGRAIGAFTQLQTVYNEAKQQGDTAYAADLTRTHLANAENILKTAGLNMEQQLAYGGALNEAKMLQAKLDQDFNSSLIDNNKYIEGQQQIAAQLQAQQMALQEKQREFDSDAAFRDKSFTEQQRQFDLGLKANPNTALRTFSDPRYGGKSGRGQKPLKGDVFTGLS